MKISAPKGWAEKIRFLVESATRAPSSHNTQPWQFSIIKNKILVFADFNRALAEGDPENRELYVSVGASLENILTAAMAIGLKAEVEYFPNFNSLQGLAAIVTVNKGESKPNSSQLQHIWDRHTNRSPYLPKQKIAAEILKELKAKAEKSGLELKIFSDKTEIVKIGEMTKKGMTEFLNKTEFREELSSWIRHDWSKKGDGLPGYSLGMPGFMSIMAPTLIKSTQLIGMVAEGENQVILSTPHIGVISAGEDSPENWLKTGMLYQEIALYLHAQGVATAILTAAVEVPSQRKIMKKMLKREPTLLFRIGMPTGPSVPVPRRNADAVLVDWREKIARKHNPYLDGEIQDWSENDLARWYLESKPHELIRPESEGPDKAKELAWKRFAQAYREVPAYREFLLQSGWKGGGEINNDEEWRMIPIMDKKNYISQYDHSKLVSNDKLSESRIVSLSSGSSGNVYFWPRGAWQEIEGAIFHERLLSDLFQIDKHKTLLVVAFSMGGYLAGTYTFNSVRWVGMKGYPLTVITPGIDMKDGLEMIEKLGSSYEQIILAGYPPYIKDLLEAGRGKGIDWNKWKMKMLFASEFFSEKWRSKVAKEAGIKDPMFATTNIYGASEGTLFGWETPEAIFIRNAALKNKKLLKALFGGSTLPTLVEYDPDFRYFEQVEDRLILTAWGGIPLIRYDLKDHGGVLTASVRRKILQDYGIVPDKNIMSEKPMVYLLHRADGAASLYGVLIYPEYIMDAIESSEYWDKLTGRFTLISTGKSGINAGFSVHVELKSGEENDPQLVANLKERVKQNLLSRSREYAKLEEAMGKKVWPKILLVKNRNSIYFSRGIKQKWISH